MTGARMLSTLRERIERIETHGAVAPNRIALGHGEADAALQGGLAKGALHEVKSQKLLNEHEVARLDLNVELFRDKIAELSK